jgi:hypothetical protein
MATYFQGWLMNLTPGSIYSWEELCTRSANGASRPPRMAPLLAAGPARKGLTAARWPRENRTSGISHPRGVLKDVFTGDSKSGDDN